MTSDSGVQVDMPDYGVTIRGEGDTRLVYMKAGRGSRNPPWKLADRQVLIGKQDPSTGKLIPNSAYWNVYVPAEALRMVPRFDSVLRIGEGFLVGAVMSRLGLVRILDKVLGVDRSRRLRTAALFMACRGGDFSGLEDFCEMHAFPRASLDAETAERLFSSITHDERMAFFKKWVSQRPASSYSAYVATLFSSSARGLLDADSFGEDGERLPRTSYVGCVSDDAGLPGYYVSRPGSIEGQSFLRLMTELNAELGVTKSAGFVLDEGFCSIENVDWLTKNGHDFIMGIERGHEMARKAARLSRQSIESVERRISPGVFGMASKEGFFGSQATLHAFYDRSLAGFQIDSPRAKLDEERKIPGRLERAPERHAKPLDGFFSVKLKRDGSLHFAQDLAKTERASQNRGFFCLITNTSLGSAEVLRRCRRQEAVKKSFGDALSPESRERPLDGNSADGKMFCAFIALIATSEIGLRLGDFMRKNELGLAGLLSSMKEMLVGIDSQGWRLLSLPSKKQRAIMKEMGLDDEDLMAYLDGELK